MFVGFSVIFQKSAKELSVFHMSVTPGITVTLQNLMAARELLLSIASLVHELRSS